MRDNSAIESGLRPLEPLWRLRLRNTARRTREQWRLFARTRVGLIGLGVIAIFGLMAVAHPLLMRYVWDVSTYHPVIGFGFEETSHPAPPSGRHLLGTDPVGRDILSMLMFSARAEFTLGLVAAVVTVVIGTGVGALSAYFGGWVDTILMRVADIVIMMPTIALLVVLGSLWNLSFLTLALVIGGLSGFGATAVIIKSQALTIVVKPYIEASRGAGAGHLHVIMVHIVPNLLPIAFLYMMFTVTAAIFSEAVLSFFGILNVRMSWGIMIHTAQSGGYLLSGLDFWWLLFPAGLSITLLSGSFYLVGRALDQLVNPRLRSR
ncbi:MAG: ABC transporter permease [Dehalococcoidia bacterium]|jgi:peptide/nickel transport system permease protein|nr:ABC transporter permease [Dehalococcoidia bacterium]